MDIHVYQTAYYDQNPFPKFDVNHIKMFQEPIRGTSDPVHQDFLIIMILSYNSFHFVGYVPFSIDIYEIFVLCFQKSFQGAIAFALSSFRCLRVVKLDLFTVALLFSPLTLPSSSMEYGFSA